MALVWRKTCGETRLCCNDVQVCAAVWTCLCRIYSNPERVIGKPRALTKSSRVESWPRTASQARRSVALCFQRGKMRSFRPLPRMRTLGVGCHSRAVKGHTHEAKH